MRTTRECYEALLAGKTLVHLDGYRLKFASGRLVDRTGKDHPDCNFVVPEDWSIHTPSTYTKLEDAIAAMRAGEVLGRNGSVYRYRITSVGTCESSHSERADWLPSSLEISEAIQATWTEVDDA